MITVIMVFSFGLCVGVSRSGFFAGIRRHKATASVKVFIEIKGVHRTAVVHVRTREGIQDARDQPALGGCGGRCIRAGMNMDVRART